VEDIEDNSILEEKEEEMEVENVEDGNDKQCMLLIQIIFKNIILFKI